MTTKMKGLECSHPKCRVRSVVPETAADICPACGWPARSALARPAKTSFQPLRPPAAKKEVPLIY